LVWFVKGKRLSNPLEPARQNSGCDRLPLHRPIPDLNLRSARRRRFSSPFHAVHGAACGLPAVHSNCLAAADFAVHTPQARSGKPCGEAAIRSIPQPPFPGRHSPAHRRPSRQPFRLLTAPTRCALAPLPWPLRRAFPSSAGRRARSSIKPEKFLARRHRWTILDRISRPCLKRCAM